MIFVADPERLGHQPGRHIRSAQVAQLALVHQVVERAQRLVQRRAGVGLVDQVHVQVLDAQAAQAGIDLAHDLAARQAAIVRAIADRIEHLRAEQQLIAHRAAFGLQPRADVALAAPAAIGIGGVEEVDAQLPGGIHDREGLLLGLARPKNAGALPIPPKLPQPRPTAETFRPVRPRFL